MTSMPPTLVGIIMGSTSDWETMSHTADTLQALHVSFDTNVVSAHRTPHLLEQYASEAERKGIEIIIAGAGGAAHLPGMMAAYTHLPIIGVPVESKVLKGIDSLLSIVQMPAGIPVATVAIGTSGAKNAGLLAASILGIKYPAVANALKAYRTQQTEAVLQSQLPQRAESSKT